MAMWLFLRWRCGSRGFVPRHAWPVTDHRWPEGGLLVTSVGCLSLLGKVSWHLSLPHLDKCRPPSKRTTHLCCHLRSQSSSQFPQWWHCGRTPSTGGQTGVEQSQIFRGVGLVPSGTDWEYRDRAGNWIFRRCSQQVLVYSLNMT